MEAQKQEAKKKPTPNVVAAAPKNTTPVVKQAQELATTEDFAAGGWDTEVVDTKDIIIPKILLMHPTSDLVKKGTRNQGEIIKSTSGDVVAKRGETFDVLVFEKWKEWRIMKKNPQSNRFEYVRLEPWTSENDNNPWEYTEGADTFRRDKTINFYGIIAKEAEAGNAFPIKLSFVRTGFKTGMKIADAYARALMEKQPPTRQVFKIGSELVTGKEETFFAFTAEAGAATTDEQKAAALKWRQVVQLAKKNNTIVDHEVDDVETTSNTTVSEEF
jgi:hypothetical protein